MNDSGRSVKAAMQFFKLEPDTVLVVHDESDLDFGRLQARLGGGTAGHNGVRSVAEHLGTQDFLRLRVGVGRPGRGDPRPLADWVLSDFAADEDAGAARSRRRGRGRGARRRGARGRAARRQHEAFVTPGTQFAASAAAQRKRAPAGRKGRLTRV